MSEFVGNTTGDFRVIRLDTYKVYSAPGAVSYDLRIREDHIRLVLNRYALRLANGVPVVWFAQFMRDNPGSTLPVFPTIRYVDIPKYTRPENFKPGGKKSSRDRDWMRIVYRSITTWLEENSLKEITVNANDLYEIIMNVQLRTRPRFHTTPSGISRHIQKNVSVYSRVFDLVVSQEFSFTSRKYVNVYKFVAKEGTKIIIENAGFDRNVYAMKSADDPRAYPVVRERDGRVFSSVGIASRMTGHQRKVISWCCKGDIEFAERYGIRDKFFFGRYV